MTISFKPFGMEELLARIEAHLRREDRKQWSGSQYSDGPLTADFSGKQVLLKGENAGLTPTEYQIVELLLTHRGSEP